MDPTRAPDRTAERAQELDEAAAAVRAEHRACSKSILLRCHAVAAVGPSIERIFALEVTRFTSSDWTWEGAHAFAAGFDDVVAPAPEGAIWSGEVVEVDDVGSRVFVKVDTRGARPTPGSFVVQPFDYLEALRDLYASATASAAIEPAARSLGDALLTASACVGPRAVTERGVRWSYVWGPPGTGKTWTLGELVADALEDRDERVLVVSTTNKATDQAAMHVARALRARGREPTAAVLRRAGSGADGPRLRGAGLAHVLDDDPGGVRDELAELLQAHRRAADPAGRAALWARAQQARSALSAHRSHLADIRSRVVVTTSFLAVCGLAREESTRQLATDSGPFTSIFIDEAGLIARVGVAALSLWAGRRVTLVGDPRQLSPISRIARVLEPRRARWIARSGLEHLREAGPGVRLLLDQRRMHPDIRRAVSDYAYAGQLRDAPGVRERTAPFADPVLAASPRAIWYVLDAATADVPRIRAERGPGGRSWVRSASRDVVARVLRAHPELARVDGMFVSPFVAQARAVAAWFTANGLGSWRASTTHAQQGAEADVVLFDTVHASSTAWSHDEWVRLVNVGMSRARHLLIVLASRLEMREPYIRRLARVLAPRVLRGSGGRLHWEAVPVELPEHDPSLAVRERSPTRLGAQLESRKAMRPILGAEQERLCRLPLDGKPRLVRGVAGSGKTAVLAHWLARRVADPDAAGPFWVVYANRALIGLLQATVDDAWRGLGCDGEFPWREVTCLHALDLLQMLEHEQGWRTPWGRDAYDFEARAARLCATGLRPRCRAMFVDEAQDFGETTLALLARLIEPTDGAQPNARAMNIFFDNAQNVYGRGTPRWVDLGLDMQGRSTVMKESYRSTRPIVEFALNVLYRLQPPDEDADHRELVVRDLIHPEPRNGRTFWRVRFTEVDGPWPECRRYSDRRDELRALRDRIVAWIRDEGVRPGDIRILANTRSIRTAVGQVLPDALRSVGARLEVRSKDRMDAHDDAVLLTTAHSFKGHDSEIVVVPGADAFVSRDPSGAQSEQVLAAALYVAMTRARSVLSVTCIDRPHSAAARRIVEAMRTSFEDQRSAPPVSNACTEGEELIELVERLGSEHRQWLVSLSKRTTLQPGPIVARDGAIVAEPLFQVELDGRRLACFEHGPSDSVARELDEIGVGVLRPGD